MDLLRDCIAGMQDAGIDQWDDVYPDRPTLASDVENRTMFLAFLGEELAGATVLNDYQNPEYAVVPWEINTGRAAVVHRLMVAPAHQGKGIARALMAFAEQQAREQGYASIRLDAFANNPRALNLYEALGYRDAGSVRFRKGLFRCFEKKL